MIEFKSQKNVSRSHSVFFLRFFSSPKWQSLNTIQYFDFLANCSLITELYIPCYLQILFAIHQLFYWGAPSQYIRFSILFCIFAIFCKPIYIIFLNSLQCELFDFESEYFELIAFVLLTALPCAHSRPSKNSWKASTYFD